SAGARAVIRRRLRRAVLQLDGTGTGADQRAGGHAGACDRRVLDGGQWDADVRRNDGWIARWPDRDSLVACAQRPGVPLHGVRSVLGGAAAAGSAFVTTSLGVSSTVERPLARQPSMPSGNHETFRYP